MTNTRNSIPEESVFEEEIEDTRNLRIQQLDHLLGRTITGFERSQKDVEECIRTEKLCSGCHGTGKEPAKNAGVVECDNCFGKGEEEHLPGKYKRCEKCHGKGSTSQIPDSSNCSVCGGKGKIVLETTKVKQRPGDPAFLNAAKVLIVEAAKMEGLFPVSSRVAVRVERDSDTVGLLPNASISPSTRKPNKAIGTDNELTAGENADDS